MSVDIFKYADFFLVEGDRRKNFGKASVVVKCNNKALRVKVRRASTSKVIFSDELKIFWVKCGNTLSWADESVASRTYEAVFQNENDPKFILDSIKHMMRTVVTDVKYTVDMANVVNERTSDVLPRSSLTMNSNVFSNEPSEVPLVRPPALDHSGHLDPVKVDQFDWFAVLQRVKSFTWVLLKLSHPFALLAYYWFLLSSGVSHVPRQINSHTEDNVSFLLLIIHLGCLLCFVLLTFKIICDSYTHRDFKLAGSLNKIQVIVDIVYLVFSVMTLLMLLRKLISQLVACRLFNDLPRAKKLDEPPSPNSFLTLYNDLLKRINETLVRRN